MTTVEFYTLCQQRESLPDARAPSWDQTRNLLIPAQAPYPDAHDRRLATAAVTKLSSSPLVYGCIPSTVTTKQQKNSNWGTGI